MSNGEILTVEYKIIDTFDWEFGHRDNFGDVLMDRAEADLAKEHNLENGWYAGEMGVNIVGTGFDAKFLVTCILLKIKEADEDE